MLPFRKFVIFHDTFIYHNFFFPQLIVQLPSYDQLFATSWTAAGQASLPLTLSEFAQVHVHCIAFSVAVQPSHPLMPSSPSALNLSQHQGLFQ